MFPKGTYSKRFTISWAIRLGGGSLAAHVMHRVIQTEKKLLEETKDDVKCLGKWEQLNLKHNKNLKSEVSCQNNHDRPLKANSVIIPHERKEYFIMS